VPRKSKTAQPVKGKPGNRKRPFRVLVVDQEDGFTRLLQQCSTGEPMQIDHARTIAEAHERLSLSVVDLAVIDQKLPDGSGLELAAELDKSRRITQTILISQKPDLDVALRALRAGATDFLSKTIDLEQANMRLRDVIERHGRIRTQNDRVRRLRRLCKKLNQARIDVSHQVDVLCNDLVTAYQELATQMQQVVQTSQFSAILKDELDLEAVLRKSLEYLIEKAGPTNAAIFLPSSMDEYSLGGYVNYDCTADSADMLLEHLGDVLAVKVADREDILHVTDNDTLAYWLGQDATYLRDSHMVAFPVRHDGETLAVIVLFRNEDDPFDHVLVDNCVAIAPLLGETLARVIRIHHRHMPDIFEHDGGSDDYEIPF